MDWRLHRQQSDLYHHGELGSPTTATFLTPYKLNLQPAASFMDGTVITLNADPAVGRSLPEML